MAIFTLLATTALWTSVSGVIGSTAAGALIALGQSVTWSLVSAAIMRSKVDAQTVKATVSQTNQPRIRAYGRNLLGGVRVFFESGQGELFQVVACHQGAVDGLIQFWWDGKPVPTANNSANPRRYQRSYFNNGGDAGDFGWVPWRNLSLFPTLWTTNHRLRDQVAYLSVFGDPSDEDFGKVFPRGPNTSVQVEVRGVRVRNLAGALEYSENAGLCIRDFLTHPDGWGFPSNKIDLPSFTNFTALSAEPVPLRNGGQEPRYSLCGYYSLEDTLKDVTVQMLAVCDGQLYETAEGRIGILGGAWSEPDVIIDSDDILDFDIRPGIDPLTTYNVLKGSFTSPNHAYQPTDVMEMEDTVALATQEARREKLELKFCPSGSQLQRLMDIKMAKDRRKQVGQIKTNLVGMKARYPSGRGVHTIRLNAPEINLVGVYEVTSHNFDITNGFCLIGIASISNVYGSWSTAKEKPIPPGYSSIPTPDNLIGNPSNPSIFQQRVLVSSGVYGVQAALVVDNPGRNDLRLSAQIAQGSISDVSDEGGGDWTDMNGGRLRASSSILDDNTTYTVRIKWKGRTDWVRAGAITVTANSNPPPPPTDFSILAVGSTVALDWRNASSSFYRTQVWRGTTSNLGTASPIQSVSGSAGQVSGYDDEPGVTGTLYYWLRTLNGSGVQSTPVGPLSVTL